jgi:Fuc2NAc and GlcNAc transferase
MNDGLIFFSAAVLGIFATGLILVYARKHLLDQINERSSHRVPTPRGGGLGIVTGLFVVSLPVGYWSGIGYQVGVLLLTIFGMSALGWWDDHRNLSARLRLPIQLLLVGAVCFICGLPMRIQLTECLSLSVVEWWYIPIAILGGGWLVNLTNFMDGIDGIAGSQGLIGCLGLFILLPSEAQAVRLILLTCAGACLGFLVWNWSPAKIFMGDVGSTALGLVFVMGVFMGFRLGVALELLLLPLAPFIFDATSTLLRRGWRRERLYEAHRSHLYQRLATLWQSHRIVTIVYNALAIFGCAVSFAMHQKWINEDKYGTHSGVIIWLILWCILVWYGMVKCPVDTRKKMEVSQ